MASVRWTGFAPLWMWILWLLGSAGWQAAAAVEEIPRAVVEERGLEVEAMIEGQGEASLQAFAAEHLSPEFRATFREGRLLDELRRIRSVCRNAGGIAWHPLPPDGVRMEFEHMDRVGVVDVRLQAESPHLIRYLALVEEREREREGPRIPPFTWPELESRLLEAEGQGFSGSVLVLRDGEPVIDRGYGFADREREIPNTPQTLFAIGSNPIDFTWVAILKLEEIGELKRSDPITRFFDDVPADKRGITIEHLVSGRSGLRNFHHVPGVDGDPDLTWIDRDTAVDRILSRELLFEPGTSEAHSHSAWVLLAAVVEVVSRTSYEDFLRMHLFDPADMNRTGLYSWASRFPDEDVAVGYGMQAVGDRNAPDHWGPTSWLVMGSGGMVSTTTDLQKWYVALRDQKIVSVPPEDVFLGAAVSGGNDRGFFCLYTLASNTRVVVCSNSHEGPDDLASQVARALAALVLEERG